MAVIAGRVALDAAAVSRCRRRVHLDHDPGAAGEPRAAPDPALEQRRADALTHRDDVGARLAAATASVGSTGTNGSAGPNRAPGSNGASGTAGSNGRGGAWWVDVPPGPFARRAEATAAALRVGAGYIWNAVLPLDTAGARSGDVDLLVRTPDGGYRPVIVVNHRVTDPGAGALTGPFHPPSGELAAPDPARRARSHTRDQLRLAHLVRMLESAGYPPGGRVLGGVIGLDADVVLWHDLSAPSWPGGHSTLREYDRRFADRLAVARAALEGRPALAEPSRITECRRCPWWPTCERELAVRHDVSLVVRGDDAAALRAIGIRTVAELAACDPAATPGRSNGVNGGPDAPSREAAAVLRGMPMADAVALARAYLRGLPLVRRVDDVPVTRADVEVDIDMESFGESGAYLWGCLLSTPDGADIGVEPGYRAFATWTPLPTDDEARSFAEFWGWLRDVRARCARRGLSFAAYCYNEQAENRWLLGSADRFAGHPGVPTRAEIEEFIRSDRWVDLFAVVSRWFLCAHGKGLKRVAPVAGFAWADPEASGENSMRWYRDAVGLDGDPPDAAQRARLLRYNADDVHATQVLRTWMCSPALREVPLASQL